MITTLSVKQMPVVDRLLDCALPTLYVDRTPGPDMVGVGGTCFAVRYRTRTLLVTAAHVVQGHPVPSLAVPTSFERELECVGFDRVVYADAADDGEREDVAVLVPSTVPVFDPAFVKV